MSSQPGFDANWVHWLEAITQFSFFSAVALMTWNYNTALQYYWKYLIK